MFRLRGWQFDPIDYKSKGPHGPRYAGKLTRELIYKQLPKGVLEEKHVAVVTSLMREVLNAERARGKTVLNWSHGSECRPT